MKKGNIVILSFCALFLCMTIGIFIGRNTGKNFIPIPTNSHCEEMPAAAPIADEDYRLNVNTATKVQLMELPGIGDVLAQRIIDYRDENGPYRSLEELLNVSGVGMQKLKDMQHLIKVG